MSKKVLIMVGGDTKDLEPFKKEAEKLGIDLVVDDFSNLEYLVEGDKVFEITISGIPLEEFSLIYIRLVGKRQENAYLLVNYAKEKKIRVFDEMFLEKQPVNIPLTKGLETKFLFQSGLPIPKTYFAKLKRIVEQGETLIGFPMVLKETTSKKSKGVWLARDIKELENLAINLKNDEQDGKEYFVQEFIGAKERIRVLVVGKKAIAAITRSLKWNDVFLKNTNKGLKKVLNPIPIEDANMAIKAAVSLGVTVAGVDIIHEDKTGKAYILEINPAPKWEQIKKIAGVNVEREILEYFLTFLK